VITEPHLKYASQGSGGWTIQYCGYRVSHFSPSGYRQYLHWQIRKQQPDFAETQIFVEWLERAIPQQGNDRDCGIYALLFGLYAVLGLPMTFSVCHMDYFRRKLAWDLLSGHIHLAIEHINTGTLLAPVLFVLAAL
jgi:hypothetical protein